MRSLWPARRSLALGSVDEPLLRMTLGVPFRGAVRRECALHKRKQPHVVSCWRTVFVNKAGGHSLVCPHAASFALRSFCSCSRFRKIYDVMRSRVTWPGMPERVKTVAAARPICRQPKPSSQKTSGLITPLPAPMAPFRDVSFDIVLGMLNAWIGSNSALGVVKSFPKLVILAALTRKYDTKATMDVMTDHRIALFGVPESVILDRVPKFTSTLWRSLARLAGVQLRMAASYRAREAGQSERWIRTVVRALRAHLYNFPVGMWYRGRDLQSTTFRITATGLSPRQLCYAFTTRTPAGLVIEGLCRLTKDASSSDAEGSAGPASDAVRIVTDHRALFDKAGKSLLATNERIQAIADCSHRSVTYQPGD